MNIFAGLIKVDESKRLIYGRAVQEIPDTSGEIFDYARSKPHFEKWSEDIEKSTDGLSFGNVRAMHGKVAAGKITEPLGFNDAEKAIDISAKIVDDNEWKKVLEGVYTGFSIGGKYIEKWKDPENAELVRYEGKPSEISLADVPCIKTATFFEIVKTDGTVERKEFQKIAAREDVKPEEGEKEYGDVKFADEKNKKYPIDTEAHIRAAWNYINKPKNAGKYSAEDVKSIKGKIIAAWKAKIDKEGPPSAKLMEIEDLKKYAGEEIGDAATAISALSSIAYLYQKEMGEGMATDQIDALRAVIENLKNFIASEIMESDPGDVINLSAKPGDLFKVSYLDESGKKEEVEYLLIINDLQKAGARHSKADNERIQGIHDHAAGLGADCSSTKVEPVGDLQKVHDETITKMAAVEADLAKSQTENADLKKVVEARDLRIKELEKEPAPPKGVQKSVVVEKSQDSQVLTGDVSEDIRKLAEKVEKQEARPDDVLNVILKHGGMAS